MEKAIFSAAVTAPNPLADVELSPLVGDEPSPHVDVEIVGDESSPLVDAPLMPNASPGPLSEQETASWWQWLGYFWVSPLLARGWDKESRGEPLAISDLLRLPSFEDPCANQASFRREWHAEIAASDAKRVADPCPVDATPEQAEAWHAPSLARALWRTYRSHIIVGGVYRLISDGCTLAAPFVLRSFISWMNERDPDEAMGWAFLVMLVVLQLLMGVATNSGSHHTLIGFEQMRSTCILEVFEAALRFPADHQATGRLMTSHSSDTAAFVELAIHVHSLWVSPLLVVGAVIAMCIFVGWAGLACFGLMLLVSPIQGRVMKSLFERRRAMMKETDKRVAAINECLQGIRICKFMSWEDNFSDRIELARDSEIEQFSRIVDGRAFLQALTQGIPPVLTLFLFAVTYLIDAESMTAANVFPALTLMNALRSPLMFIPQAYAKLFDVQLSCMRVQRVLLDKTRCDYVIRGTAHDQPTVAAAMDKVKVFGRGDQIVAEELTATIPRGALVIVTGPTGSGKSTLVNALVGEARIDSECGEVRHYGTMALVPQEPWIMNATVRGNVIMDEPFDEARYLETLRVCQLTADLEQLPAGEFTEIGERGINISGGQKQRIALARAVYSSRDTVVMDDPLSAVDAHVSSALVDECICGALSARTRILITHQSQLVRRADYVIVMEHCKIAFAGTVAEMRGAGHFPEGASEGAPDHVDSAVAVNALPLPPPRAQRAAVGDKALVSVEEVAIGSVAWSTYGWYIHLGRVSTFLVVVLMALAGQAAFTISSVVLARWSSKQPALAVLGHWSSAQYLQWMGIFTCGGLALIGIRQFFYAHFVTGVAKNIHSTMTRSVLRAPTTFFDTTPMGRIINRFTKDMSIVDSTVSESLGTLLNMATTLCGTIFLVCYSSAWLILIFPPLIVTFYWVYRYYTRTVRGIKRLDGVSRSPMLAIMNEALGGLPSIRVYELEGMFVRTHAERVLCALLPGYNLRCAQRWLGSRTEIFGAIVVLFCVLLGVLARTHLRDSISLSPSVIALAISSAITTTNTITFLTRTIAGLATDMSSTERLRQYTEEIPQERTLKYQGEDNAPVDAPPRPPSGWPAFPEITLENFNLRYRPGLPLALQDVSVSLKSRNKVGIVGRTGSGKSTLILAIFRIVEALSGCIKIDGRDIATLKLEDLRRVITIIPQDPLLFTGTVRTNIDPFGQHTDAALWAVLDKLRLRPRLSTFITEGPRGLEAVVAERGNNFSAGQRQLLCMARALLKNAPIIMLDEATASLDFEADSLIQTLVRSEFRDKTVITIAHRLATVMDSDRILVMANGEVAEFDSPKTLMRDDASVLNGMARRLGPEQFTLLRDLAEGRATLSATALELRTSCD